MEMRISLCFISVAVFVAAIFLSVDSQDMQPKVTITETDPPSDGERVRGFLAKDVWLNCYVENLPDDLSVRWQMVYVNSLGAEVAIPISQDMGTEDNMKWSIEKPTQFSWRLRIKALTVADEGNYTCYVRMTTNNNRAESNRTVFVTDPPLILEAESSSDITAKEGEFVPLRCNASGRPLPTMMWRREGNAVLPGGGVRHLGSTFDIDNIQFDARGRYICEGFNEVGYDRRDIVLSVQHSPKVFPDESEVGQAVGYQRTMICQIEANPPPSIDPESNQVYWSFQSQRLLADDKRAIRILVGAYNRLTFELITYHVQSSDYGTYQCHARNSIGDGVASINLYETSEPQEDKRAEVSGAGRLAASLTPTGVLLLGLLTLRGL